jgi:hypothetical protein
MLHSESLYWLCLLVHTPYPTLRVTLPAYTMQQFHCEDYQISRNNNFSQGTTWEFQVLPNLLPHLRPIETQNTGYILLITQICIFTKMLIYTRFGIEHV